MSKPLCWGEEFSDDCNWNKAWMELYAKCMEIMTPSQKELIWEMIDDES